ncbi:hypothetical protein SEPCBS57363_005503 [Sporothrix epigloea]|uniref:DUF7924 domain-containing protein n=1 Tax=Sporothrix epigloea TaxID=1892477 RepID=A0ABP0E1T2_9PEZI
MATSKSSKRQCADETLQSDIQPLTKKTKTRSELDLEAWYAWVYPPEFYDRLSKISLNPLALNELQRRIRIRRTFPSRPVDSSASILRGITCRQDLTIFARQGGPDLCDLRDYPFPPTKSQLPVAMDAGQGREINSGPQSVTEPSTEETKKNPKSQKTGPFNVDFSLHLADHQIHPPEASQEPEMEDIMAALAAPRPGDLLSQISAEAFKSFRRCVMGAKSEGDVLANVVPTLLGQNAANFDTARNLVFAKIRPLTDGSLVAPKPDLYDGVNPITLAKAIREELADVVVPSKVGGNPVVPNFFFEIAGTNNKLEAAELRARYHGAIGARAMTAMQNYGKQAPVYDGMAYTFSAVLSRNVLEIFAHHITAPTTAGGKPEYHMNSVSSTLLSENRDALIRGITAFRNCRDLAKRWRDDFAQAANAPRLPAEAPPAEQAAAAAYANSPLSLHIDNAAGPSGIVGLNGDGGLSISSNLQDIDGFEWQQLDPNLLQHYLQMDNLSVASGVATVVVD